MTRNLILGVAIISVMALSGCTSMLIGNALNQGQELTPDEIRAYNEIGFDVHSCVSVIGPPPSGSYIKILTPKARNTAVKFGVNCQVIQ